MDTTKAGKPGAARTRYLKELVAERLTGIAVDHYVSPAMQWGLDRQAEAIQEYEIETGSLVGPEESYYHKEIDFLLATPDGFVGEDGLLEVKCPTSATHLQWILDGVIPEQHIPQMSMQLICTERDWVDFMSYDPRMPMNKRAFIRRFEFTNGQGPYGTEYVKSILKYATDFLKEVDDLFERVTSIN